MPPSLVHVPLRLALFIASAAGLVVACGSDETASPSSQVTVSTPLPIGAATTDATTTQPATTQPATTEPATTEPATTEPETTEPATTEPATTEPATTEPATTTTALARGWAIHDALASEQSGQITNYDGISCESASGPWHITSTFSVDGNLTHDVFYDVAVLPDGSGTVTGEEHSTWSDGLVVDGTFAGTSRLEPPVGDELMSLVIDYDASATFTNPAGPPDSQVDHLTKTLKIIPAAPSECP